MEYDEGNKHIIAQSIATSSTYTHHRHTQQNIKSDEDNADFAKQIKHIVFNGLSKN